MKKNIFLFWGGGKRWPQMVSTQGDFCPYACVFVGPPTVILRVPSPAERRMLGCVSPAERRMLGCVHVGQPTVIFRDSARFSANAWICARRATDRDLDTKKR